MGDSDVEGSGGDDVADDELRARLNEQIARTLWLQPEDEEGRRRNIRKEKGDENPLEEDEGDASDDEFEFRLFSTSAPTTKVVLEDEKPRQGGLVAPRRPESYYVVTTISDKAKQRYAYAAVSGEEVLRRSQTRSWGLELPWKVTHISTTGQRASGQTTADSADKEEKEDDDDGKRRLRRPGKKRRIALRGKARAAAEKAKVTADRAKTASQRAAEKEEHLKEKKKRMNRLKKLRKRAKNREKKGGEGTGEGTASDGSEGDSE